MARLTAAAVLLAVCWPGARAPAGAASDVYTDNVVIVLDASGSMKDPMRDARSRSVRKIDAAKTALLQVLRQVPATTHVGVLVFSAENVSDPWIYPLGPRDDARLAQAISLPEPGGNTPLGTFMAMGRDVLLKRRNEQLGYGTYRLLVVTDGEANSEPPDLVDRCTVQLLTSGITVDVIGVGMSQRHTLATKVHSYRSAADPDSLARAVREVFAEVGARSGGSDAAAAAVFEVLGGIPDQVAASAIRALSSAPRKADVPGGTAAVSVPPAAPAPAQPSGGDALPWSVVIGALAVLLFFVVAVSKAIRAQASRKRGR